MLLITVITLLIISFSPAPAAAQFGRQEVHAFQSATLSDAEFLTGRTTGTPVTLAGHLRVPRASGKVPAVVLLHGSGGMSGAGSNFDVWAKTLNEAGFATFTVDSFAGRAIVEAMSNQDRLSRLNMIIDAYRALETVAKHRLIDADRIAVIGFSRGADSAVYSSLARFQAMHAASNGPRYAAHIGFYMTCNRTFTGDDRISKPARLLHGTADDFVPIEPCRAYVERLAKAGQDIKLIAYADAHHVFDAPAFKTPLKLPNAPKIANCVASEGANGTIVNHETKQPFAWSDACVGKGATVAYHEASAQQAEKYVVEFLREALAIK